MIGDFNLKDGNWRPGIGDFHMLPNHTCKMSENFIKLTLPRAGIIADFNEVNFIGIW